MHMLPSSVVRNPEVGDERMPPLFRLFDRDCKGLHPIWSGNGASVDGFQSVEGHIGERHPSAIEHQPGIEIHTRGIKWRSSERAVGKCIMACRCWHF